MPSPIRILTAVPICDGHDSAINTINLEFIRHGIEVVYLGFHRYAGDIVRAAIQEDVAAIGISSYNGGHIDFFAEVVRQLRRQGAGDIAVFGGGGGTITYDDARLMKRQGVDQIFFAGTSLTEMADYVGKHYGKPRKRTGIKNQDLSLARELTAIEDAKGKVRNPKSEIRNPRKARVIGFTGPGGAGKTTLIDELVLRFLRKEPKARIAILSHDPSVIGKGALLGDRATMINSQDDRVFMRSMATRGQAGGLSPATESCLARLTKANFDYVIIETVGTGQEALPFRSGLIDQTVLVMNPDYGARLQLQKIVMLDAADIVVVNKTDLDRAKAALSEIEHRLTQNKRKQRLVATVAKRHRDPGVDELYEMITGRDASERAARPPAKARALKGESEEKMSKLGAVIESVEKHEKFVHEQVKRARTDKKFGREITERWNKIKAGIPIASAPTGLPLPRLALPEIDEAGEIARYLFGDGLPGEFPYLNGAYREMYLEPLEEIEMGSYGNTRPVNGANGHGKRTGGKSAVSKPKTALQEEPTRLFSGLMLAEDTNKRFHFLSAHQRSKRLSTAFDGPTLYGIDSDAEGVMGKIGEGGVAVDTVEDMVRLYDGFEVGAANFSASMTISGPAPIIMAMYIAAAKRRFGASVIPSLRGTIQADIFKEVQAQNETIFPTEASLRFLCDMIEWTTVHMPRWYPVSISGYHIGEAGSTPVQQAAYTLSNGFAYAEMLAARGVPVDQFGPRLSFFLDCGLDVEYIALSRVSRKIWAIGMRDVFGASPRGQMFKLHTQTSGRSLIAAEFKNNLTRTAAELMLAYMNGTNSCHSNSADEPFTTPSEEWIRLAAHGQAILLEESGIFKHTMNMLSGSPGMKAVERAVEKAILEEFREIESLGGVLAAVENRYQRSQIQNAAHRYEEQIYDGTRPIVGLTRYRDPNEEPPKIELARTPRKRQELQVNRLKKFKQKNASKAEKALNQLAAVVESGENTFPALLKAVEVCSLGQITGRLQELVGHFRPMV